MNRVTIGGSNTPVGGATATASSATDKSKDWQLEILMEKLRSKSSQFKTMAEISKNVRMTLLEKRYPLDSVEKSQHQKCLDTLQHSIKVTSLQSMIERLESLTRQLGLKFMVGPSGVELYTRLFISSDMFYLEIVLDQSGQVKDVKVHHGSKEEEQSCSELLLVNCLSRGDFDDFTAQLEGFASIYQLNAEKKIKCKAFTALQSLESDLSTLAQLQSFMKEPFNLVHKSPVGILEKRRGGHAMKLTYFVSPYDLLNVESHELDPITIDAVVTRSLGYSVTVCMEGSATHKLQTTTLITVNRNVNGKSTPSYTSLNNQNSAAIPACFMLKLNGPMPMSVSLVRQIQQLTEIEFVDWSTCSPLLNLIVGHSSEGKMESANNKGLFVTLPDQNHCYFMTENKTMDGVVVTNVPFTHPAHVSQILVILRQQALFNTIIGSCVRPNSKQDFENMVMFEVGALCWSHISISLEHPLEESMATAEIDLSDISSLLCRIRNPSTSSGTTSGSCSDQSISDLATKILNRSFSIPVTMRSVIKLWEKQIATKKNLFNGHENFSLPLGSDSSSNPPNPPNNNSSNNNNGSNDGSSSKSQGNSEFGGLIDDTNTKIKQEFNHFQSDSILSNLELANILQGTKKIAKKIRKRLDEDNSSRSSCDSNSQPPHDMNATMNLDLDLTSSALELLARNNSSDNLDLVATDVEELLSGGVGGANITNRKNSLVLVDLGDKLVPPSVSITPIASNSPNFLNHGGNPEKRPGIEIIPLANSATLPSSITITPITTSSISSSKEISSNKSGNDKKSGKNRSSDDRNRLEKKRKRKRDESPMGPPPDKVPLTVVGKADPLNKPVSVSIKPAESPPSLQLSTTPTSPNLIRSKYNTSPVTGGSSSSGKSSPNLMKSPKNSPKHPSTSGSGKPSMSTLKNAQNSPKNDLKSKLKDCKSDKDGKKATSFQVSNLGSKLNKNSLNKVNKSLDLDGFIQQQQSQQQDLIQINNNAQDLSKNSIRNRKNSLSAIVDKLKSAQHCDNVGDLLLANNNKVSTSQRQLSGGKLTIEKTGGKLELKNSEYMVKPGSDGMKITINKTRTKDLLKSGGNLTKSGSNSPKTHTGLKPGVNSGPASKKPQNLMQQQQLHQQQQQQQQKVPSSTQNYVKNKLAAGFKVGTLSKSTKLIKSSPQDLVNRSSGGGTSSKQKSSKTTEKSLFVGKDGRKSSPTPNLSDLDVYKAPLMMKHLDKNFQIPKLSARTCTTITTTTTSISTTSVVITGGSTSLVAVGTTDPADAVKTASSSSSSAAGNKGIVTNNSLKTLDLSTSQQKLAVLPAQQAAVTSLEVGKTAKILNDIEEELQNLKGCGTAVAMSAGGLEDSNKFVAPAPKDDPGGSVNKNNVLLGKKSDLNVTSDGLLDFSVVGADVVPPTALMSIGNNNSGSGSGGGGVGSNIDKVVNFPQSPSVSVHIVKSPASSPIINPSPLSASPCITDDELMDEALVGLGK